MQPDREAAGGTPVEQNGRESQRDESDAKRRGGPPVDAAARDGGPGNVERAYAIAYGMGAAVSGLMGLPPADFALGGTMIGAAALVAFAVLVWRGWRPDPLAIAAVAALFAEHLLWTIFRSLFGVEYGSRSGYVYVSVVFLWLAIGATAHVPDRRTTRFALGIVVVAMVVGNMRQFVGAARASRDLRATKLAELQLVESIRQEPNLITDVRIDDEHLFSLTVRGYLDALERFGRPTLGGEWRAFVDQPSVDAARGRILPR